MKTTPRHPRLATAAAAALMFAHHAAAVPIGLSVGDMAWNDEFNGTSLDSSHWNYRQPGVRHDATNAADAVSVGNGALSITTYTSNGIHYTGMIGTQGRFEQTYGYFEARISFNNDPGSWSAFWLQSPAYGNPIGDPTVAGMEIDVVEHRGADQNNNDVSAYVASALHWDGYGSSHRSVGRHAIPGSGIALDAWHTYGLLWTPNDYSIYFDDTLFWTQATPVSARSEYLILSSEVRDASWAGNIPAGGYGELGTSTNVMQVDYVRAYVLPEPNTAALILGPLLVALRTMRWKLLNSGSPADPGCQPPGCLLSP